MTTTAASRQALGAYGERVAERYLVEERGMLLLERNWRCEEGEVDLVLRDGDMLVVCEVKTRSGAEFGTPHEAVDEAKAQRLRRLAERWASERGLCPPHVRIDVVGVLKSDRGAAVVDHVAGIV